MSTRCTPQRPRHAGPRNPGVKPFVAGLAGAVLLAMLSGCGGGSTAADTAPRSAPGSRIQALPPVAATLPQDMLNWAEQAYPQLFPGHQPDQQYEGVTYRHYPLTGNHVGLSGDRVLVMGPVSGGPVVDLGAVADFRCLMSPQTCAGERPVDARQTRVAAGPSHTLVVNAQGAGLGWGDGLNGVAGVDLPGTPARAIEGLNQIAGLGSGEGFTLATTREGGLLYLHQGAKVPLVAGAAASPSRAVPVAGATQVVAATSCAVRGTSHAIALRQDGSLWVFGTDTAGKLVSPYRVTTPIVRALGTAGPGRADDDFCEAIALTAEGRVLSLEWKRRTIKGVVKEAISASAESPARWPAMFDVACSGHADGLHCLATTTGGQVVGWGDNTAGQLGLDPLRSSRVEEPTRVPGLPAIRRVWAGQGASYALAEDGSLYAWGSAHGGTDAASPMQQPRRQFAAEGAVADIALGDTHLVLLMRDGSLRTRGANTAAQLGRGDRTPVSTPMQPAGFWLGTPESVALPPVARIAAPIGAPQLNAVFTLTDGGSRDADGDPLSWHWTLTARPAGSSAVLDTSDVRAARITPDRPGAYTVALVVNDGAQDSRSAQVNLAVADPSGSGTPIGLQPAVAAILQSRNCLACHSMDKKVVGPSFQDIVRKYRVPGETTPAFAAQLRTSIVRGSVGRWGPIPMPPSPQVTEAELAVIIDWLLVR